MSTFKDDPLCHCSSVNAVDFTSCIRDFNMVIDYIDQHNNFAPI